MRPVRQAVAYLRQRGPRLAGEGLVVFVLPVLVYDGVRPEHGEVAALLASSLPPLAWTAVEFARRRRVDALSMLVLAGIVLSLLAFLGGGGARFLQLREKCVTALIGLVFLGSVAIRRPLIFHLARAGLARRSPTEAAEFERLKGDSFFEQTMTLMTLVWGFGLLADAALSALLVFILSVRSYLLVAPMLGYGTMGGLGLWTLWFRRRQQRIGKARREAGHAGLDHGLPSRGELVGGPGHGPCEAGLGEEATVDLRP